MNNFISVIALATIDHHLSGNPQTHRLFVAQRAKHVQHAKYLLDRFGATVQPGHFKQTLRASRRVCLRRLPTSTMKLHHNVPQFCVVRAVTHLEVNKSNVFHQARDKVVLLFRCLWSLALGFHTGCRLLFVAAVTTSRGFHSVCLRRDLYTMTPARARNLLQTYTFLHESLSSPSNETKESSSTALHLIPSQ